MADATKLLLADETEVQWVLDAVPDALEAAVADIEGSGVSSHIHVQPH